MKLDIKIKESGKEIYNAILRAVRDEVAAFISPKTASAEDKIRKLVLNAITNSPEFISLANYGQGELGPEFGFIDGTAIQQRLIPVIEASLIVKFNPKNIGKGRFIDIQFDKNVLINASIGSYNSNKIPIPWLKWLLEDGASDVVYGYSIKYNLTPEEALRSRSQTALMVAGGSWHVPSAFAGVDNDNFITRAITPSVLDDIEQVIQAIFT